MNKELKGPAATIGAYSRKYHDNQPNEPDFFVTAWLKKNKKGKYSHYRQLVIDNYDFYCLFVFLVINNEKHGYKKAIAAWGDS